MRGGKFVNDGITPNFLEENVEKAKWEHEMHARRLEWFEPPIWEDFVNTISPKDSMSCDFISKDKDSCAIYVDFALEIIEVLGKDVQYDIWELSKENYIKACTIARKLFLGESVDGIV